MQKAAPADIGAAIVRGVSRGARLDSSLKTLASTHTVVNECVKAAQRDRTLYAFGSLVVFGVSEAKSDVDFVLLDPKEIQDGQGLDDSSQTARAVQAHCLGQVAKEMRNRHRLWKVQEVRRTRVPVLRVDPPAPLCPFDVSAGRRCGVRNSWLLRAYFEQRPSARWLAMAVKRWSKASQMNGPQCAFLTSYGFNIMVIHYYMNRGLMQHVPLEVTDVAKVPPLPTGLALKRPNVEELGNEVLDFCNFYASEFDYESDVVSLSRPGSTTRSQLSWTRADEDALKMKGDPDGGGAVNYRLCIEDPYEVNLNVGRMVTAFKLDYLRKNMNAAQSTGLGFLTPEE